MAIPTLKCGVSEMPVVGLGTWQSKPGEVTKSVSHALKVGYKHIDCAHVYGNEAEVGAAFTESFSTGVCKREEIFVTSKLWNTFHRKEDIAAACDETLKNLAIDYLDLYLIHWPVAFEAGKGTLFPKNADDSFMIDTKDPDFSETWGGMEELVKAGKVKNIGLSNFTIEQIEEVLSTATIKPACLQVESHPHLPNLPLLEYCKSKDMVFVAYSPLGNPGSMFANSETPNILRDPTVLEIAAVHGVSAGQVLIRYQLDKGNVTIPKSITPSRIEQNQQVFHFTLTSDQVNALSDLSKAFAAPGRRTCRVVGWAESRYYPFREELDN